MFSIQQNLAHTIQKLRPNFFPNCIGKQCLVDISDLSTSSCIRRVSLFSLHKVLPFILPFGFNYPSTTFVTPPIVVLSEIDEKTTERTR